jgi:hypothetical protein
MKTQQRSYAWRELLIHLQSLAKGDSWVIASEEIKVGFEISNERFAEQLRSQLSGSWRAYLSGSAYYVRSHAGGVTVSRTG